MLSLSIRHEIFSPLQCCARPCAGHTEGSKTCASLEEVLARLTGEEGEELRLVRCAVAAGVQATSGFVGLGCVPRRLLSRTAREVTMLPGTPLPEPSLHLDTKKRARARAVPAPVSPRCQGSYHPRWPSPVARVEGCSGWHCSPPDSAWIRPHQVSQNERDVESGC